MSTFWFDDFLTKNGDFSKFSHLTQFMRKSSILVIMILMWVYLSKLDKFWCIVVNINLSQPFLFVRTLVIIVNIKPHRRAVWQRIPCNQCEYKATTQSSLMTHIESVHEKLKYPCNEVSHIIRKITFIMILPAFRDREYCLNVS